MINVVLYILLASTFSLSTLANQSKETCLAEIKFEYDKLFNHYNKHNNRKGKKVSYSLSVDVNGNITMQVSPNRSKITRRLSSNYGLPVNKAYSEFTIGKVVEDLGLCMHEVPNNQKYVFLPKRKWKHIPYKRKRPFDKDSDEYKYALGAPTLKFKKKIPPTSQAIQVSTPLTAVINKKYTNIVPIPKDKSKRLYKYIPYDKDKKKKTALSLSIPALNSKKKHANAVAIPKDVPEKKLWKVVPYKPAKENNRCEQEVINKYKEKFKEIEGIKITLRKYGDGRVLVILNKNTLKIAETKRKELDDRIRELSKKHLISAESTKHRLENELKKYLAKIDKLFSSSSVGGKITDNARDFFAFELNIGKCKKKEDPKVFTAPEYNRCEQELVDKYKKHFKEIKGIQVAVETLSNGETRVSVSDNYENIASKKRSEIDEHISELSKKHLVSAQSTKHKLDKKLAIDLARIKELFSTSSVGGKIYDSKRDSIAFNLGKLGECAERKDVAGEIDCNQGNIESTLPDSKDSGVAKLGQEIQDALEIGYKMDFSKYDQKKKTCSFSVKGKLKHDKKSKHVDLSKNQLLAYSENVHWTLGGKDIESCKGSLVCSQEPSGKSQLLEAEYRDFESSKKIGECKIRGKFEVSSRNTVVYADGVDEENATIKDERQACFITVTFEGVEYESLSELKEKNESVTFDYKTDGPKGFDDLVSCDESKMQCILDGKIAKGKVIVTINMDGEEKEASCNLGGLAPKSNLPPVSTKPIKQLVAPNVRVEGADKVWISNGNK